MKNLRKYRSILLLGIFLFLSACGFSLRSSDALSSAYSNLNFFSQHPASELSRLILRSLESSGVDVQLLDSVEADTEQLTLIVSGEQIISRPITVNPRARAAQHELRLEMEIALGRDKQYLISPETLFVERVYFEDIENISGNQEEVEIITSEMRRELGNQLIRRLSAVGEQVGL